jgi:1-deoxy-D-xylulose 5-phosphate reductoisomerase
MFDVIEKTMDGVEFISHPTLDDYLELDKKAREFAGNYIKKL